MATNWGRDLMVPQAPASMIGLLCALMGSIGGTATSLYKIMAEVNPAPNLPNVDVNATNGLILSISVGVIGLFTQIVNGIFAGRKLRREVTDELNTAKEEAIRAKAEAERRVADALAQSRREIEDAKAEAARLVANNKAESDRMHAKSEADRLQAVADNEAMVERRKAEREFANARIMALENENLEFREKFNRVLPHIETAARGIDKNSAGLKQLAEAAGIVVPMAPKMNGGHGAMDDAILGIGGPPR